MRLVFSLIALACVWSGEGHEKAKDIAADGKQAEDGKEQAPGYSAPKDEEETGGESDLHFFFLIFGFLLHTCFAL